MRAFWKLIVVGMLAGWGASAYAGSVWTENASGVYAGTGVPWNAYEQDGKWVTSGTGNVFTSGAAITASDGPLTVSGTETVVTVVNVSGNRLKVNGDGVLVIENASVNGDYVGSVAEIRIGTEGSTGTLILRNGALASTATSNKNVFIGSDNELSTGIVRSYGASSMTAEAVYVGVRGNSSHTSELSVEDGTLTVHGKFAVGGFTWSNNTGYGLANVKAGATLIVTGDAHAGYAGTGTLDVSGAATFEKNLTVGNYLTESAPPYAYHATGSLTVHDGGVLTVSGYTTLGHESIPKLRASGLMVLPI